MYVKNFAKLEIQFLNVIVASETAGVGAFGLTPVVSNITVVAGSMNSAEEEKDGPKEVSKVVFSV